MKWSQLFTPLEGIPLATNDNDGIEDNVAKRMLFKRPALWKSAQPARDDEWNNRTDSFLQMSICNRIDMSCSAQPCKATNDKLDRVLRPFVAAVEAAHLGNLVPSSLLCCPNACSTVNQCS